MKTINITYTQESEPLCLFAGVALTLSDAISVRNELTKIINEHQKPIAASLSNSNAGVKRFALESLFIYWQDFSQEVFPLSDEASCIHHAISECIEVLTEHDKTKKTTEYADIFMCLLTAMRKSNIYLEDFIASFQEKFNINKSMTWKLNADKSYSHI